MEIFNIEGTEDTPRIFLSKKNAILEISGRSLPEDAAAFYGPVKDWLKRYGNDPNETTEFVFRLEYVNTVSIKFILGLLSILKDIKGVKVVWYNHVDDEDMQGLGEELEELMALPFEFKVF